MTDHTNASTDRARAWTALWLSDHDTTQILNALTVAADTEPACTADACPDPDQHSISHTRGIAWRALAVRLATLIQADRPAFLVLNEDAARVWLRDGAADDLGIDESFNSHDLTIVARLEELLYHLGNYGQPDILTVAAPLTNVSIWRTADGDGIDGGAIITIDLTIGDRPIRLATLHQGFNDFTLDEATSGIDAAIESLRHVTRLVNTEIRNHLQSIAHRLPTAFTVVGIWENNEPVPVGVIAGDHHVIGGDESALDQGGWATSVTAPDPATARAWAVTTMRSHRQH
jgi:hypothetical protein